MVVNWGWVMFNICRCPGLRAGFTPGNFRLLNLCRGGWFGKGGLGRLRQEEGRLRSRCIGTYPGALVPKMDEVVDPQFWNSDDHVMQKLGGKVVAVETTPGCVKQRDCCVQPLALTLADGEVKFVVAKIVTLVKDLFRDDAHLERTKNSYRVESAFYQYCGHHARQAGASTANHLVIRWNEEGSNALIVVEDLRQDPNHPLDNMTGRSIDQKLVLNLEQAKAALHWLAKFHACFWGLESVDGESLSKLWPEGSYWSLGKRSGDLDRMESEWEKTVGSFSEAFPEEFSTEHIVKLGSTICALAEELDSKLRNSQSSITLVHGDFKTANLFFGDGQVSACDFQWTGPGAGVKDVIYLIWTSVDPQVVQLHEEELLNHYYVCLISQLSSTNGSENSYTRESFYQQVDLAFLDYIRFLIGSMWGSITPESCAARAKSINQGTHKRFAKHLVGMVSKAANILSQTQSSATSQEAAGLGMQGTRLVSSLVALCIILSESAGAKVREILSAANGALQSRDKDGDGPQTLADLEAEKIIISGLSQAFPGLNVVAEEGVSANDLTVFNQDEASLQSLNDLVSDALQGSSVWEDIMIEDLTVWVDPLDGTKEFLDKNYDAVTTLIGIAHKGTPIAGVVHQPFFTSESRSGQTWWGGIGCGVYCNRNRFQSPNEKTQAHKECIVATTRSHPSPAVQEAAMRLNPDKILPVGGIGNKAVLLLTGQATHYVFPQAGTKRWDTCAPEALLCAAGGRLVNKIGEKYNYDASCNPRNEDGVLATATQTSWNKLREAFDWDS